MIPSITQDGGRPRGSYFDPHFTIGLRDVPTNLKLVLRLTRFYYNTDSLMRAIVYKMAEYPITDTIIESPEGTQLSPRELKKWKDVLDTSVDLRQSLISNNEWRYVFGQAFRYLYLPFVRYCRCQTCNKRVPISTLNELTTRVRDAKNEFTFTVSSRCPTCKATRTFDIEDRKSVVRTGLKLVPLSPLSMELNYNSATGHQVWYWTPPKTLRSGLMDADRAVVDNTEMDVLRIAYRGERLKMNPNRLWVTQAPGMPGLWDGWGVPPLFSLLDDVYYYKILRKANEALAHEYITPMRIISPGMIGDEPASRMVNLQDWQVRFKGELAAWKRDPNHLMVSPFPVNTDQLGGTAKSLMVAPEMEAAARVIAAGIGCPIEMIWGGLNWSGASVSLRVLENHFINTRQESQKFIDFLVPRIAAYFGLPRVKVRLADFKMADDAQANATAVNLLVQGFLSRETVLPQLGFPHQGEFDKLEREHKRLNAITMADSVASSHMNSVIKVLEAKADALLQFELAHFQERLQTQDARDRKRIVDQRVRQLHEMGLASPLELEQSAQLLGKIDPAVANLVLAEWNTSMPHVTALLMERLRQDQLAVQQQMQATGMAPAGDPNAGGDPNSGGAPAPDAAPTAPPMQAAPAPLPEQRPPQRENSPI